MATGGTPTVTHTAGSGRYDITWPGENWSIFENVGFANPVTSQGFYCTIDGAPPAQVVFTRNAAGALADPFGFSVMIMQDAAP